MTLDALLDIQGKFYNSCNANSRILNYLRQFSINYNSRYIGMYFYL